MKRNLKISIVAGILAFVVLAAMDGAIQAADGTKTKSGQAAMKETAKAETNSQILVTFVELGSVNCIPCKMMQPVMAEIEKEYGTQVKVVFYDVWTQAGQPYAEKYQIRAIPTQVFLDKDGKEYFRHMGFFPKADIVKVLKKQGVK
jgi:thioredoxin 1